MCFPQLGIGGHDDVYFDEVVGAGVISPNSIQFLNIITIRQRLVYNQLNEFMWRCFAGEEFELEVDRAGPGDDDAHGDLGEREH